MQITQPVVGERVFQIRRATPTTGGTDFAGLVERGAPQPPPAVAMSSRPAALLPAELYPGAADSATGAFRIDRLESALQRDGESLTADIKARLREAGINVNRPFDLDVAADGNVVVRGDHPCTAEIEAIFADDPTLANRYRRLATGYEMVATGKVAARYAVLWEEAGDDKDKRDEVLRRETADLSRILQAGGRMGFGPNGLASAALEVAARISGTPLA